MLKYQGNIKKEFCLTFLGRLQPFAPFDSLSLFSLLLLWFFACQFSIFLYSTICLIFYFSFFAVVDNTDRLKLELALARLTENHKKWRETVQVWHPSVYTAEIQCFFIKKCRNFFLYMIHMFPINVYYKKKT